MDEVKKKSKQRDQASSSPDRVTLTPDIGQKMNAWLEQLNDKFGGLIELNKSDLVNFFLSQEPDLLSKDRIEKIKAAHYDEVRFMQWALVKMKESKRKGEALSLKDLLQLSEMKSKGEAKRTRKAKSTESLSDSLKNESLPIKKSPDTIL